MIEANEVNSTFYALRLLSHGLDISEIEVTDGEEYPASEFTSEEQERALELIHGIEDSEALPFDQLPRDRIDFYLTALADRIEELANKDLAAAGHVETLALSPNPLESQISDHYQNASPKRAGSYESEIDLVGRSGVFIEVMKQVGRVAETDLPVLLTGESGTGKEFVASALHQRSKRAQKSFVAVNCGAIPPELIESELFGHVRGSFTGAERARRGLWEEAEGGTIFLDEITETTPAFQVKLLRALQEGEIRRVGSNQTQKLNVRVIAASNRDVEAEVKAGRFRQDLFYRLNTSSIVMPPLRERREDILPLAKSFAERVLSLNSPLRFSSEALALLESYPWPGNIRELENAVVRAAAMCDGTIRPQNLPERVRNYRETVNESDAAADVVQGDPEEEIDTLAEIEGRYVAKVLQHTRGNKQAAARLLSVDRKTLDRMIKRHKIGTNLEGPFREVLSGTID